MALEDSVSMIKGVGAKTEQLFAKMDIYTKQDLLLHYPRSYDQFGKIQPISALKEGEIAAVEASVSGGVAVREGIYRRITACEVSDGTGIMNVTWFNMPFLRSYLKNGKHYISGKGIQKIRQPENGAAKALYKGRIR